MIFNSLSFLIFITLFFAAYYATRANLRLWVCLIASYIFYAWWDWRFTLLIAAMTLANFYIGLALNAAKTNSSRRRWLWASIFVCLIVLGFFKYFNFFTSSVAVLFNRLGWEASAPELRIILPVGISFYTFQVMSYVIDLYYKRMPVEDSLLRFATFVAFFPQLVAGPIVRADEFLPQLKQDHPFNWSRWVDGFSWVIWGVFLKCALADSLAPFVDGLYSKPAFFSSITWMIGTLFYSFQIYGDFAGYSFMAIGLAHMLGFHFNSNFNRPYFSASFSEFWQRWHISLSSWLRDYLYIPLGGNRKGTRRTYINLMITMLLGGLWHGANWTFLAWGLLHGSFLCLQRSLAPLWKIFERILGSALTRCLGIVSVFMLINVTWIFFRAQSIEQAWFIIERIAALDTLSVSSIPNQSIVLKGFLLISFVAVAEALSFRINFQRTALSYPWMRMGWAALIVCSIALFGTFGSNSFIYFQF